MKDPKGGNESGGKKDLRIGKTDAIKYKRMTVWEREERLPLKKKHPGEKGNALT